MKITKREDCTKAQALMVRAIAILIALVICAFIIVAIVKINPLTVYGSMFKGVFGTKKRIWITLRDTAILSCIAVGLAPAFKMKFWNIGAEGQMLMGAVFSSFIMINNFGLSNNLTLIVMFVASVIGGAIWGIIPAFFKSKWNTNETLFTLMMNYIAIQFTSFCVALWENPKGSNSVGIINPKTRIGWIGDMFPSATGFNTDYGYLLLITLIITVLMFIYLNYTRQGYEIMVVGDSTNTANYCGISVPKVYMRTMAISGAICGIAGFLAVSCASHTISTSTAGGRGFTAIIIAYLSKMNPFIMLLMSLFITFLNRGSIQIASDYGLNEHVSNIITGILLLFILGSEFFINYEVSFTNKKERVGE